MKTKLEKQDNDRVKINIEVPPDRTKLAFDGMYERLGKEAKVPGFRPGKVPREILEKHYSKLAHEEVLKDLLPQVYKEAIEKEGLAVIDAPEITDVKLTPQSFSFNASVQIKPDINLKQYKKIKINYKKVELTSQDIDNAKEGLKKEHNTQALDDNFARGLGYISLKDLEGSIEKQIFLQKENQNRLNLENQIVEQLKKLSEFKLPQVLVNRRLDELLANAKVELAVHYGYTKEQIAQEEPKIKENLTSVAQEQVRVYLIFEDIARKENMKLDDSMTKDVMELLLREAVWSET